MNKNKLMKIGALLLALCIVVLLSFPAFAGARAGGGHVGGGSLGGGSFGGSIGSGSGGVHVGGSSLGGGGFGSFIIFIIIVAIIWYLKNKNGGNGGMGGGGSTGGGSNLGNPPTKPPVNFDSLKVKDPAFNEQLFYGRVNEMFMAIQNAWMNRDMQPAQRFMADQQFNMMSNQVLNDYIKTGRINVLESIHVVNMVPVEVREEGGWQAVKMLITAACIDYTIDEKTKTIVNPSELGNGRDSTTFQEYWTFVRSADAKTDMMKSISKCPNCGGMVTEGNYVKCAYCGQTMNNPTFDWVLLQIEQVN